MEKLIRDGHNGKSAGPDGVTNELEKDLLRIPQIMGFKAEIFEKLINEPDFI